MFLPDLSSTEGGRGGETGSSLEIEEREQQHRELLQETVAVGIMFASKAFVQLLANPIVGPLTHKYANRSPIADRQPFAARSRVSFSFQNRLQHTHVHRLHHHVPFYADIRVRSKLRDSLLGKGAPGNRIIVLERFR